MDLIERRKREKLGDEPKMRKKRGEKKLENQERTDHQVGSSKSGGSSQTVECSGNQSIAHSVNNSKLEFQKLELKNPSLKMYSY